MYYFSVDFDKLGLTDNENPYGDFPSFLARSMGSSAASMMAEYVGHYLDRRRGKRSVPLPPEVEGVMQDRLHGGERYVTFPKIQLLKLG